MLELKINIQGLLVICGTIVLVTFLLQGSNYLINKDLNESAINIDNQTLNTIPKVFKSLPEKID